MTKLKIIHKFNQIIMKSISNEAEYNAIVKRLNELLEIVTDENYSTIPEAIELDFLSALIEEYENRHYPIEQPTLVDTMRLRMYEMGVNQNDLSVMLGVSPSRVSEYLNGKCEPTLPIARKISQKLDISAAIVLGA
jgi:HTH-type transcriptional regulator/antitoxin HigA